MSEETECSFVALFWLVTKVGNCLSYIYTDILLWILFGQPSFGLFPTAINFSLSPFLSQVLEMLVALPNQRYLHLLNLPIGHINNQGVMLSGFNICWNGRNRMAADRSKQKIHLAEVSPWFSLNHYLVCWLPIYRLLKVFKIMSWQGMDIHSWILCRIKLCESKTGCQSWLVIEECFLNLERRKHRLEKKNNQVVLYVAVTPCYPYNVFNKGQFFIFCPVRKWT